MGIYDLGYRPFKGKIGGRIERIWAIFIQEFIFRFKQKYTIVILVLSYVMGLLPTIVFTYFLIQFAIVAGEEAPIQIFFIYFSFIFIWVVIFTTVVGSPIISNDLKNNSIILYFSRPLTKEDYFLGKYVTIVVMISFVTFIPALIMSVTILGLATEQLTEHMDVYKVVFTLLGVAILMSIVFGAIALVLSSLTRNYLYAGVGIFTILVFSNMIALLFSALINDNMLYLSIWQNFLVVADDLAGFNTITDFHWYNSLGVLLLICFVCITWSWNIIRRLEGI